jgi:AcrR family transcriptional regulator
MRDKAAFRPTQAEPAEGGLADRQGILDSDRKGQDASAVRMSQAACGVWRDGGPAAVTFGAVAEAAGAAKSLVSHHFATRDQLLQDAARRLAADGKRALTRLGDQFTTAGQDVAAPVDTLAVLVEFLAASPPLVGIDLLELAALGLDPGPYRALFLHLLDDAEQIATTPHRAEVPFLRAFILGELLNHCPRHAGIPGLAGLRQRLSWLLGDQASMEGRWISGLMAILRDHRPEPGPAPAEPSPPPRVHERGAVANWRRRPVCMSAAPSPSAPRSSRRRATCWRKGTPRPSPTEGSPSAPDCRWRRRPIISARS